MGIRKVAHHIANEQAQGATRGFLEDLFEDYYAHRFKVYRMNLIRGIMFGFGSVIGASLVAIILLLLVRLFKSVPLLGHFIQQVNYTVQSAQNSKR